MNNYAIITMALLVLSACSNSETDTIKIGWIGPLTGPASSYGVPELNGAEMAIQEINAQGGIEGRKVELIIEDARCEGALATNAATKLIEIDGVSLILGGHCSTESMAIIPILNDKAMIMIAGASGTDKFSGASPYAFRTFPSAKALYYPLAEFSYTNGAHTMATLHEEKDWPKSVVENFATRFAERGGKLLIQETFAPGTVDFRTILLKIKQQNSDAIMLSVQGPESAAKIIDQMSELEMDSLQIYGDAIVISVPTYENTKGRLPPSAVGALPHVDPNKSPGFSEFISRYQDQFGELKTNPFYATEGYDGAKIATELIKTCGADAECMRNTIIATSWKAISGTFDFSENGDPDPIMGLARVENGKLVFINNESS